MKKLIIAGAVLAAVSTFAISAFAADTSNTAESSANAAAACTSSQCTQTYCPQDGTGNRYGANDENGNCGKNGSCKSCPNESCTNVCDGTQQKLRIYSEK